MDKIKELIVVEGKHDYNKLKQYFNCDIICTGGLGLDQKTIDFIKEASQSRGVIVLTDPDQPGERIRKMIAEQVPEAKHGFIEKKKAIGKRNVGIEYTSKEDLEDVLNHLVTFSNDQQSLSWSEYLELNLVGNKALREEVALKLHIGPCNNKTMFKRLNQLAVTADQLRKLVNDANQ